MEVSSPTGAACTPCMVQEAHRAAVEVSTARVIAYHLFCCDWWCDLVMLTLWPTTRLQQPQVVVPTCAPL